MQHAEETPVDFYKKNGYYLWNKPVFSPDKFQQLQAIFNEMVTSNPGVRTDTFDTPHFKDERLLEFLTDDAVLDLVEPFIGPHIGLWSSHFISKEPGIGRRTPWHTDADYWQGRFDRYDQIITVWLALDKVDKENGCMKVIPGTHLGEDHTYTAVDQDSNLFSSELILGPVVEASAVCFELAPNTCSLHDARIVHGADPNTSNRRRCGYTMRYFSQTMRLIPENNQGHHLWHCRGKNIANNPVVNQ